MKVPWKRVNRERRCPICDRPDWCLISEDGSAVICARCESPKRCGDAGWLHRLVDEPRRQARHFRAFALASEPRAHIDFGAMAQSFQAAVNATHLDNLAQDLGVSVNSLRALGIGWAPQQRAWAFPMTDPIGAVLGIRLRLCHGRKLAVQGGKEGLFIPRREGRSGSVSGDDRLLICEGPTDTAAILDLGFPFVIGRPSCMGGVKLLVEAARKWKPSVVVIVADGDEPGQRGADRLASALLLYVPAVKVIAPPNGAKDARAWLCAGGTLANVEEMIQSAKERTLGINSRQVR